MTIGSIAPTARLQRIGLSLPPASKASSLYIPAMRTGPFVQTSGQLPLRDGVLAGIGRLGDDVTIEDGAELARLCTLNALAAVAELVDLDSITAVVKLTGYVAATPTFIDHPAVMNGASTLLHEVFGDLGAHTRSAIGVASLPFGSPVEVELVVQVAS